MPEQSEIQAEPNSSENASSKFPKYLTDLQAEIPLINQKIQEIREKQKIRFDDGKNHPRKLNNLYLYPQRLPSDSNYIDEKKIDFVLSFTDSEQVNHLTQTIEEQQTIRHESKPDSKDKNSIEIEKTKREITIAELRVNFLKSLLRKFEIFVVKSNLNVSSSKDPSARQYFCLLHLPFKIMEEMSAELKLNKKLDAETTKELRNFDQESWQDTEGAGYFWKYPNLRRKYVWGYKYGFINRTLL